MVTKDRIERGIRENNRMDEMNLGLIGTGNWGANLVRNFYELKALKIVCDKNQERLEQIKTKMPEIETTEDFNQLLSSVDSVVIATSASSHYELLKQALLQDKDVFVEKPLALSVKEGEELVTLATNKSRILMVGHLLLYHPAIWKIKEYIDKGTLGEIHYMYSQRVNLGKIRKDENALWSFGPHDISVILYLIKDLPLKVSCTGESYLQNGIFDVVFCTLHFKDKKIAHIHLSWLDPHKIRKFTIVGSKKMAVFDDMETQEKIRLYDKGVDYRPSFGDMAKAISLRIGDILVPKIDLKEPLKIECQRFLESVKSRKPPISDGENGLEVLKVLDAAQKSLDQGGKPVNL